jgi:glutaminyl-peptide cyclotransferase
MAKTVLHGANPELMKRNPYSHARLLCAVIVMAVISACSTAEQPNDESSAADKKPETVKPSIPVPSLNADSAFQFVQQQVDFGPRIPGTKQHAACAAWLQEKLESYLPGTVLQTGVATTFDKRKFTIKNIIASYNPGHKKRILLCAHWDTRPFADRDTGAAKNRPFDGANDGGSGTGVLLEIARLLSISKPDIGVDIILFDLEDYGQPDESSYPVMNDSWCLGAQYWAKNLHKPGYFAQFGILLDMVGAKGAVFPKEGTAMRYAPGLVDRIWKTAGDLGYGSYFINSTTRMTTDDHLYINEYANIPCAVIVHYDAMEGDYFDHHHRLTDTMEQIDKEVLRMTGQVVLQVVFDEAGKGI